MDRTNTPIEGRGPTEGGGAADNGELGQMLVKRLEVHENLKAAYDSLEATRRIIQAAAQRMMRVNVNAWILRFDGAIAIAPKDTGDVLQDWPSSKEVAETVKEALSLRDQLSNLDERIAELRRRTRMT